MYMKCKREENLDLLQMQIFGGNDFVKDTKIFIIKNLEKKRYFTFDIQRDMRSLKSRPLEYDV